MMKQSRRNFRLLKFVLSFFGLLALAAGMAFGQSISGNVVGTVLDSQGAVLVGAEVSATNTATGEVQVRTSNSTGEYRFDNLPVGTYTIVAKMKGFRTISEQADVLLNKTGTRNLSLTPGAVGETVEVSAAPPAIDTTTAQLGSNYDNLYSQELNITSAGGAGSGVLNLSLLSPGVSNASSMGDGMGPSVGGMRPRDNNFTVEGVDNNNKTVTGALVTVPNDAVDSFTLLENQFNSEFGHSSGGQFNTTVKSGTNSYHGSVYEYFRNRNLNAVDNSSVIQGLTSNPRYDSNRYGGTFGGPIVKNKLFFFTDFERQPIGAVSLGSAAVSTPTAAGLAAISVDPNLSQTNFNIFKQFVPQAGAGTGCIQFNGQVPSGETYTPGGDPNGNPTPTFSSFSTAANGICPAGEVETGNVPIVPPNFSNYENLVVSLDYNMSSADQWRGRFIYNKFDGIDTASQLAAFYTTLPVRFDLLNLSEFHTFTTHLTNEFRTGFNRFDQTFSAGSFNYPGLDVFPNVTLFDLGGGLNVGPDPNAPQFTIQNFYQFVDNVSWLKGKHNLKFGAEYRWYISPQQFTQRARGDYEWNNTQLYLEDFSPDFFGQRSTGLSTYYGNQNAIYWYVNDTFKATAHLSLNLGVRYEYTTTPTGEDRQSLNSIASTPSVLVAQADNEPLIFDAPRAPKNNFAPRIGVVYSPGTSGNTSIRAGFGTAYDTLYDNIGILAVPPQIGSTESSSAICCTSGFLAGGGLGAVGGAGLPPGRAAAIAATSDWVPPNVKDPYSINWNLGVQHSFGKNYTAEVNYVGTRGVHLDFQDIINLEATVTPTNFLPTYTQNPGQAALNALPLNLNTLLNEEGANLIVPEYNNAGFNNNVLTAFVPLGSSVYHGLQTSLIRRFSNGLTFQAAYTWSRDIDNSTADFHTSDITPRRPQDFQDIAPERSVSALSRTHRLTIAAVYDLPFFKSGNWFEKNLLGNWEFSPIYTYESPQWVTPQSGLDSNLNLDSAGDRVVLNTGSFVPGTGSDVTPLCANVNPCPADGSQPVVAYLANNPNAQYITAGAGALATSGRNILATRPTNDVDLAGTKVFNITERVKFRFTAQIANVLNHPQLIPGSSPGAGLGVNDVGGFSSVGGSYQSFTRPSSSDFNNPYSVFSSNSRTIALIGKIIF